MALFAVDSKHDIQGLRISDFIRRHHIGAKCACPMKIFPWRELRTMKLPVSYASIVKTCVSCNVRQGLSRSNMSAGFADDHRKFGFPIQIVLDLGANNGFLMCYERIEISREQHGLLRHVFASFNSVVIVVDANANYLWRTSNDWQVVQSV